MSKDETTDRDNVTPIRDFSAMGKKSAEMRAANREPLPPRDEDFKTRWAQLVDGDITVKDLDDEELKRMRCRDRLGGFTGRPLQNMPAKIARDMRAEWLARGQAALEEALPVAVATLAEIAAKGLGKDRLVAAQLLLERALGKVPDKVDVTQHSADPWEDITQGILSEANIQRAKDAM